MSLLGITFLVLASIVYSPQSQNKKLISEVLQQNLVAEETERYAKVLKVVTKGTNFAHRWQINKAIRSNYLNLYVLRAGIRNQPDLPEGMSDLFGSCAYLGEDNVVVCDEDFVNTFLEKRNLRDPNSTFLLWVLGHEVGHIVKGHGAAHFGPDNLEKAVASSSIAHQRELEADTFLVTQVSGDKQLSGNLISMALGLLNEEITAKIGTDVPVGVGILYDYTNKKVVKYMRLGTHPEYVVRVTRILQQLGSIKGNESLKAMVDDFARHMREGI